MGKADIRNYRGSRFKRTIITAIECVSTEGKYLNPMIIWPATPTGVTGLRTLRLGGSSHAMNLDIQIRTSVFNSSYVYLGRKL